MAGSIDHKPPSAYNLKLSALPNPFKPATTLSFTLKNPSRVKLEIYDLSGHLVAVPYIEWLSAGAHQIDFDGNSLVPGVYFARLKVGNYVQIRKLIHL
jgi:hypothetical protein